jgi:hypothetical protein
MKQKIYQILGFSIITACVVITLFFLAASYIDTVKVFIPYLGIFKSNPRKL